MDLPDLILAGLLLGAAMLGAAAERWRADQRRRAWRVRRPSQGPVAAKPVTDAVDQLRLVMAAGFSRRPLLSQREARIMRTAEAIIAAERLDWRVMGQASMGEFLACPDRQAFAAINSKRVDLLVIGRTGLPIAAIEFQGEGHHQGSAPARDAVKREALRRAGVALIELTPKDRKADLARALLRLTAQAEGDRAAA